MAATGAADIDFTAGTHGNDADTALMSDAAAEKGLATQEIEELHHSSSDDDSVPVPSHCDHENESTVMMMYPSNRSNLITQQDSMTDMTVIRF